MKMKQGSHRWANNVVIRYFHDQETGKEAPKEEGGFCKSSGKVEEKTHMYALKMWLIKQIRIKNFTNCYCHIKHFGLERMQLNLATASDDR